MCFCCVSHNAANEIIWRAKREGRVMTDQEVDTVTQRIEHDKPLSERVKPSVNHEFRPAAHSGEDMCTYSWRVESERTYCQRSQSEHARPGESQN